MKSAALPRSKPPPWGIRGGLEILKTMPKSLKDRLEYMIALITEFAAAHHITAQQAYLYLRQNKGLDFVDEFYDVEHTLSFDQAVEDLTIYCKRMGGNL